MYRNKRIGVTIPAYNEAGLVGRVIRGVPSFVDRIYVVDDASTDDTWAEIQRAARDVNERDDTPPAVEADASAPPARANGGQLVDQRVVPIQHPENRGVGGAIKTGYLRAREDDLDVVAVMAGDAQMDPDALEALLDPIVDGDADYTKGNRFLSAEARREVPAFRYVGNVLLSVLTRIASGYWSIGDSQNGYTAISRRALERVDVEDMYEFYGYCNDLLVKLNVEELRVVDVPVSIRYDEETSHISYSSYVPRVSGMLLRNFLWRLREKYVVRNVHPLVLLYAIGAVGGLATVREFLRDRGDRECGVTTALLVSGLATVLAMVHDREANEHLNERRDE